MTNDIAKRVPARYFSRLLDALRTHGIDVSQLLKMARLESEQFFAPNAALLPSEVDAFIAAARQLSGRTDLGFETGRLINPNSHDILGYGMISCASIDQMLRMVSRYFHLMTEMFTLRYRRVPGGAEAIYSPLISMPLEMLRFHLEAMAIAHQNQLALLLGEAIEPYDVHIAMPPPAHHARYAALAPVRFHFDEHAMPGLVVRMGTALIDHPLPMANAHVVQQVMARCDALLRKPTPEAGWGDYVTMLLRETEGQQLTLEDIAQRLHLSTRTIDRRLKKEGLAFRDLAQQVRFERARQLLSEGGASVSEVALRLGFSDCSNFSRAFRRIAGVAPSSLLLTAAA